MNVVELFAALHSIIPMPTSRTRCRMMRWLAKGVEAGLITLAEFHAMAESDLQDRI
jgi:hypothetical protein